jgi:putative RecB family exonuclease
VNPEGCESKLEVDLVGVDGTGPTPLKGVIDRIDLGASGEVRIVDYKTGRAPSERREVAALYQLKFYALMIYRMRGVVPGQLKLIYLGDSSALIYRVELDELIAFQRGVVALWQAVTAAVEAGQFQPHRNPACGWCAYQALCPEFGGTPPPFPAVRPDGTIEASAGR